LPWQAQMGLSSSFDFSCRVSRFCVSYSSCSSSASLPPL
jgi:hypothetical protein